MMMHRVLTHQTLRRVAAVRPNLVAAAFFEPPAAASCCCALHLWPPPPRTSSQRWVSSSAFHKAPHLPKPQSPEEEAQSRSTPQEQNDTPDVDPLQDKSIGLFQRFKRTFKQYGKVMIPLHLLTSSVWFGTFYYAAMK